MTLEEIRKNVITWTALAQAAGFENASFGYHVNATYDSVCMYWAGYKGNRVWLSYIDSDLGGAIARFIDEGPSQDPSYTR